MKTILATLMAATFAFAGTEIKGFYMEARTADVYVGPCFANSETELKGDLAVMGWKINSGSYDGVKLDGLSVVGVVKASGTIGNTFAATTFPVKSALIIDEKATPTQRLALKKFAQAMSKDMLMDVVRIDYRAVSIEVENNDVHKATAKLQAGELAAIQTRTLTECDNHCSHEDVWYPPMVAVDHAMPAYTLAHNYTGKDLGTTWSSPEKRSAFVATFHYNE
ncbi:MAG: DUF1326 domain-containing protein [Acidobacteria bacterium]|nr:DUF1326 domain-containing protein [Acidobacteriota bacterium]